MNSAQRWCLTESDHNVEALAWKGSQTQKQEQNSQTPMPANRYPSSFSRKSRQNLPGPKKKANLDLTSLRGNTMRACTLFCREWRHSFWHCKAFFHPAPFCTFVDTLTLIFVFLLSSPSLNSLCLLLF